MSLPVPVVVALVALASLAGCAALIHTRADRREAGWMAEYPPVGVFVTVEGRRIHLIEAGDRNAPAVVLIHGANGNLRDFTVDRVDRLDDEYHVIALDRPGLGWSDSWGEADSDPAEQARVLRAAVAQRGVRRAVVVGHSYGGSVAMAWALQDADTQALVLIAGATYPWETDELGLWYTLSETPFGPPARAMVAAFATDGAVDAAITRVFAPDPVPAGYGRYFGAGLSIRRDSQANNNRQVNALLDHVTRMSPQYPRLTLPIEILHGDADTIVGIDIHSRRMVAEVASARLTVIQRAGHMLHHSHPQAVVDAIARARQRALRAG